MSEGNLLVWSVQIAVLVAAAGLADWLLRLTLPKARLAFWQLVLLLCLALPLVRPWKQVITVDDVSVSMVVFARQGGPPASSHIPWEKISLWLIASGILARGAWLGAGFWRLARYRDRSRVMELRDRALLLLSDEITSPVTFGLRQPVVLLPAGFPELDRRTQDAILCHELLHVTRRDWVFTVAEELVRAVWWFHPAMWWVLGQIQLSREQVVDREVIAATQSREEYVDALLAIAGARPQLDLAPAPLFLRQRHLKQRVIAILQEVRMSRTRLISSLAAALSVVAIAGWLVTRAIPLAADAVADSPGVTVDLNGAALLHRSPVVYPETSRKQEVQGTVVVQVKLDGAANVEDAQVLSGPEALRKPALESVLTWHFAQQMAGATTQVKIGFALAGAAGVPETPPAPRSLAEGRTIGAINISGLSDAARADLLSRLPVHEGDALSSESLQQLVRTVKSFDEHLAVDAVPAGADATILVRLPPSQLAVSPTVLGRLRIGGNVQAVKLISKPRPMYPPEAKQARIQGVVKLDAIISKDGRVEDLTVISGHPLLVAAAMQAVWQWVYSPTLLNGNPTEVETEIDVNFTLSQ